MCKLLGWMTRNVTWRWLGLGCLAAGILLGVTASVYAVRSSPTFRICAHQHKADPRYYPPNRGDAEKQVGFKFIKLGVVYVGCVAKFANVHQGALTALFSAGLVVIGGMQVAVYRRQARI